MAHLAHFSINADDLPAARRFYENVFGWTFRPWGPPGFFQIETGDTAAKPVMGALQQRRDLIPGVQLHGFECTIAVTDVDATAAAVLANGGTLLMPPVTLPNVGRLMYFTDPSNNQVGAMQYDPAISPAAFSNRTMSLKE
jgi:hypothetical protein